MEPAEPVERFDRRQRLVGRAGDALAHRDDAAQHADEQAELGEVRPFRIGRGVNEHEPALAALLGGDERRAVGEPRPGLAGEVERGFRQHLARHGHVGRNLEPSERALRVERGQMRRRLPRQRAAERTPAAPERDRQESVGRVLGEVRPGKAQHRAAFFDP